MAGFDINKIIAEYSDDDFGFSTLSEDEYNSVIAEKEETVEEYKSRLKEVEKIIMPFLVSIVAIRMLLSVILLTSLNCV